MNDEEEAQKIITNWQNKTREAWLDGFAFAFESINDFMDDMRIATIDRELLDRMRKDLTRTIKEKIDSEQNNG